MFYLEWLSGSAQRRVLDESGKEHLLDDTTVLSFYKLAGGGKAKKLIREHWSKEEAPAQQPFVARKPDPVSDKPKPPKQRPKSETAPEKEVKAEPTKKTAKKTVAKKSPVAAKKPAKKAAKKAAKKTVTKKKTKKKSAKKKR